MWKWPQRDARCPFADSRGQGCRGRAWHSWVSNLDQISWVFNFDQTDWVFNLDQICWVCNLDQTDWVWQLATDQSSATIAMHWLGKSLKKSRVFLAKTLYYWSTAPGHFSGLAVWLAGGSNKVSPWQSPQCLLHCSKTLTITVSLPIHWQAACPRAASEFVCTSTVEQDGQSQSAGFVTAAATTAWGRQPVSANGASTVEQENTWDLSGTGSRRRLNIRAGGAGRLLLLDAPTNLLSSPNPAEAGKAPPARSSPLPPSSP